MAAINTNMYPDKIKIHIDKMVHQPCTQIQIRNDFSMYVSFGPLKLFQEYPLSYIGTWEIATYDCAWRFIYKDKIVCGSDDICDKGTELMLKIKDIPRGRFQSFIPLSDYDFRVSLNNGLYVDFLCATSTDSEIMHIVLPNNKCAFYRLKNGWEMEPYDKTIL